MSHLLRTASVGVLFLVVHAGDGAGAQVEQSASQVAASEKHADTAANTVIRELLRLTAASDPKLVSRMATKLERQLAEEHADQPKVLARHLYHLCSTLLSLGLHDSAIPIYRSLEQSHAVLPDCDWQSLRFLLAAHLIATDKIPEARAILVPIADSDQVALEHRVMADLLLGLNAASRAEQRTRITTALELAGGADDPGVELVTAAMAAVTGALDDEDLAEVLEILKGTNGAGEGAPPRVTGISRLVAGMLRTEAQAENLAATGLELLISAPVSDPKVKLYDFLWVVAMSRSWPKVAMAAADKAESMASEHFGAGSDELRLARVFRGKLVKRTDPDAKELQNYSDLNLDEMYSVSLTVLTTCSKPEAGEGELSLRVRIVKAPGAPIP